MNRKELRAKIDVLKDIGATEKQVLAVFARERRNVPKELIQKVYRE